MKCNKHSKHNMKVCNENKYFVTKDSIFFVEKGLLGKKFLCYVLSVVK